LKQVQFTSTVQYFVYRIRTGTCSLFTGSEQVHVVCLQDQNRYMYFVYRIRTGTCTLFTGSDRYM